MKLLQVIPYFCFGGAETMCENLTYALGELGHDVVVVSLFDERTEISSRMEASVSGTWAKSRDWICPWCRSLRSFSGRNDRTSFTPT